MLARSTSSRGFRPSIKAGAVHWGGPGPLLHIPAGVPHAFANTSDTPATMLFRFAPDGHEDYFEELAALLRDSFGRPDQAAVAEIRERHDIVQLTSLVQRR